MTAVVSKNQTPGRDHVIPSSLISQSMNAKISHTTNAMIEDDEAIRMMERIRAASAAAFIWMDSHETLRKGLCARSRPPHYACLQPSVQV